MPKQTYRVFVLASLMLGLATLTTQAQTTIAALPDAHYPYQSWVDRSQAPTPEVEIHVYEEACPEASGAFACTTPGDLAVWVNVAAVAAEAWSPRGVFLHEIGHNFADYVMTEQDRERFRQIIGTKRTWEKLEERFADEYMSCALPKTYETEPQVCHLIRASYGRSIRS